MLTPKPVAVTVVGIATFGELDSLGPTTYTAFTLPQASELFAQRPDTISAVLVAADAGVSRETLRDEIVEQVPARIQALTQAELTAEQQDDIGADFLDMFQTILLAFAGIALVVATFSIHNTFSILVAQRTRESALLRAIGASRRQVVVAVALEALVIGVVATAIGFGVGLGLAAGLQALMSGAGLSLPTTGLVVTTGTIVAAGLVGVLTTLIASVTPAIRASRVAPLAALREVAVDRSGASKLRAVLGVLIAGARCLRRRHRQLVGRRRPGPGRARRAGDARRLRRARARSWPARRPACSAIGAGVTRGFTGRLARRNAMRNPRRIAGSAAALMVGTAVVALFTTFGSSVKASIDDMVDKNFAGDLVLTQTDFSGAAIDPTTATDIAALPEVAGAVGAATTTVRINGVTEEPMATDPAKMAAVLDLEDQAGSMADVGPGEIAVGQRYAEDHHLQLGDTVPVTFVDGTTTDLTVADIYGREDVMSNLIMDRSDWTPHAGSQDADVVVFVTLADGVSESAGQAAVAAVANGPRRTRTADPGRLRRLDRRSGRPDAVRHLRPARHRRADRRDERRQHAVPVDPRADAGARAPAGGRADAAPAALGAAVGVGHRGRLRHRRRPRPGHVPRLGPDAGDEGGRCLRCLRGADRAARRHPRPGRRRRRPRRSPAGQAGRPDGRPGCDRHGLSTASGYVT